MSIVFLDVSLSIPFNEHCVSWGFNECPLWWKLCFSGIHWLLKEVKILRYFMCMVSILGYLCLGNALWDVFNYLYSTNADYNSFNTQKKQSLFQPYSRSTTKIKFIALVSSSEIDCITNWSFSFHWMYSKENLDNNCLTDITGFLTYFIFNLWYSYDGF